LKLHEKIQAYIEESISDFELIHGDRKKQIEELWDHINQRIDDHGVVKLTFICTHNSRRSHMAQIWAKVSADYYGVKNVFTFSGGTEATAFNPRAVAALERAGFEVMKISEKSNPVYEIKYGRDIEPLKVWSKRYEDSPNPGENFIAVMTCTAAEEACPIVYGASHRLSLTYEDPKHYDNSSHEKEKYDDRCRQIATEMLYCFSLVSSES